MSLLSQEQREFAQDKIDFYKRSSPDVIFLATLASPARMIEPELLRYLRLELSDYFHTDDKSVDDKLTVETEFALWFSSLVENRGTDSITLLPGVLDILRRELQELDNQLLIKIREIILDCHKSIPPVIKWEEDLIYYSLNEENEHYQELIHREILRAAVAVQSGERQRLGEWINGMYLRVPKALSKRDDFKNLLSISQYQIIKSTEYKDSDTSSLITDDIVLKIKKLEDQIEIGKNLKDADFQISVPRIEPIVLLAHFKEKPRSVRRIEFFQGGSRIVDGTPSTIKTVDKRIYKIPTNENSLLQLLNKAKSNQSEELNLSYRKVGRKLTSDDLVLCISEIKKLKSIKKLDLSSNSITDLGVLTELESLISLNLSRNQITDVSPIRELKSLTSLNLSHNQITEASPIRELKSLTSLNIDANLVRNVSFLQEMPSLTTLDLSRSGLRDISFLKYLTSLNKLDLSHNQISDASPIKELLSLTNLNLDRNEIRDISFLKDLTSLDKLDLSNNQITDASSIKELLSLTKLYLINNQIGDISFLRGLRLLKTLDLTQNQINNLSFLQGMISLRWLSLINNPNLNLPRDFENRFIEGRNEIDKLISFYKQIEEEGKDYIYEAKVLIVGEPKAGKTTLFKKLQDFTYNPLEATQEEKESTIGVDINVLEFPFDESTTFKAHLWDFGGQEKQYAFHQYFFTKRSLYILLADNRKELGNFNYWFEIIATLGSGCPVMVVLNEINKNKVKNFDISIYKREYKDKIKDIEERTVNFALEDGRFANLASEIQTKLRNLEHIGQKLPKTWVAIRKKLGEIDEPLISIDDYYQICEESGVENPDYRQQILEYLHDLGIALNYKYDDNLRSKLILKPNWVMDALYTVLKDEGITDNAGRFSSNDVDKLWTDYNSDERKILLQLMQKGKFEIAYKLENKNEYIAPILLPEIAPEYDFEQIDSLEIHFEYKFKPKGLISRLISRFHEDIYANDGGQQIVWKKGVLLKYKNSVAQVIESEQFKKITITVSGESAFENRTFVTAIRTALKRIHRDWFEDRIEFEEKVPCICDVCRKASEPHFYELETVESYYEMNAEIVCDKSVKARRLQRVNARRLLEGVYIEDTTKEVREFEGDKFNIAHLVIINGNANKVFQGLKDVHIRIQESESIINEVSPKMDETQRQAIEELSDKLITRIKEEGGEFFNQEQLEEIEEVKKGEWETKIKFSLPFIALEFSRNVSPEEFIFSFRKFVYGDDFQLNLLQTDDDSKNLLGE